MRYQTVGTERGSYGNLTASRGRFGQYKRGRVTPLNPRTNRQIGVRAIVTALAAQWHALSEAKMLAWDNYARDKGLIGTGMQGYMQVNYNKVAAGAAVVDVPPDNAEFGIFTATGLTATLDAEAGTLSLSLEGAANSKVPDGYQVEATRCLSAGRRNMGSEFRIISASATLANLGGATSTLGQAYTDRFGTPVIGKRITVKLMQVKDGQKALAGAWSALVAAA